MKKNDFLEIKKLDIKALLDKAQKAKVELAGAIMDKSMNKLTHSKIIKNKRKEIAQILTILRQKELIKQLEEGKNEADKK